MAAVQPDEVAAVLGQSGPIHRPRILQHPLIGKTLVRHPCLESRLDIMSELAELLDRSVWEVLIRKEARHPSLCGLVLADGFFNLVAMGRDVRPRESQVVASESGVRAQ